MQAVILAGGFGNRLRPLTQSVPKPLVPIANVSAMERVLRLLAAHGVDDAVVTLYYLPKMIMDAFGDEACGIRLHYVCEEKPVGTAGSVKLATPFFHEEDFLVISADVVCETDLRALMRFHKEKNAIATLALTHQNEPGEYGVVVCRQDGQIERFLEKPARLQACSDTVNAGIYCLNRRALEAIPQGKDYDFGHDLFPALLGKGLYGYVDSNAWCDIGEAQSYYECNFRYAEREGSLQNGNIVADGVAIDESAQVCDSILMKGVKIGAHCRVNGAILCENTVLQPHAQVESGAVIGANSVLEWGCKIGSGVSIGANSRVKEGVVQMAHYGYEKEQSRFFCDGGLHASKQELTPEFLLQFGKAVAYVANGEAVALLHADTAYCSLLCSSFRCGVISAGGQLLYFGVGFCALASYTARKQNCLTFCIYEDADASVRVAIYDQNGLYPTRKTERALSTAFESAIPDALTALGKCVSQESLLPAYQKELSTLCGNLTGMQIYLNHTAPALALGRACSAQGAVMGAQVQALRLVIDPTGRNVALFESGEEPFSCDFWHVIAILLRHRAISSEELILPHTAPHALVQVANAQGYRVRHYSFCPHDTAEDEVRKKAASTPIVRDACMACARLLALAKEKGQTIAALASDLPDFYTVEHQMPAPKEERVRILCAIGKADGDGVCITYSPLRHVRILPIGAASYRMICEAESVEAADEIFALSKEKIRSLFQKGKKEKL